MSHQARKQGEFATRTLLPPLEANPFTALFRFIRRRSICLSLFALTAIGTEVLTILVSPSLSPGSPLYVLPNGTSVQLYGYDDLSPTNDIMPEWTVAYVIAFSFFVLVGYRVFGPKVPKGYSIRTVADTLRLACGSRCAQDFGDVSMLNYRQQRKRVLGWEKKYKFGIVRGGDGLKRWGVDYVDFVLRSEDTPHQ
jgi:hypothetical protein